MSETNFHFSFKQVNFIAEALSFRIQDYEAKASASDTSENDRSDMENDLILLRATLKYLKGENEKT